MLDWNDLKYLLAVARQEGTAAAGLAQLVPKAHLVARNNSVLGLVYSAKAGFGLAALPTALGDAEPDLVRVLTTAELRHTPRVAALRPIITG